MYVDYVKRNCLALCISRDLTHSSRKTAYAGLATCRDLWDDIKGSVHARDPKALHGAVHRTFNDTSVNVDIDSLAEQFAKLSSICKFAEV